ncbi:hypothetical protein LXA43DRAFT_1068928 [Ganoderma leucocontextum]|nr:hypothetical protein LXA43DRAFT_1068928 [Ganoderma leucocontextum]
MIVAPEHYKIFASILNDFGQGRITVTYEEFFEAAKSLGFKRTRDNCALIPPRRFGRGLFQYLKECGRSNHNITPAIQDQWKLQLFQLYGWTADTFRSRLTPGPSNLTE